MFMDFKHRLGYIIEFFGILCLICAGIVLVLTASDGSGIKLLTVFGGLGLLFLILGLCLVSIYKPMNEEQRWTHSS